MAQPNHDDSTEEITMANTKKEMLAAYNALLKRLDEKREADMKPEEKIQEKIQSLVAFLEQLQEK